MSSTMVRRRITSISEKKSAANGLYIHSSPPRVLNVNSAHVKQLIRSGDFDKLEQLVHDGQGAKLIGEYSSDFKIRTFLKSVPAIMSKISLLHDAVSGGSLEELQNLLQEDCAKRKKMVLCKDQSGVGLLHKAIYYDLGDIAKWLMDNYPQTASVKDSEGRTPAHYIAMCKDPREMQRLLTAAGADLYATDSHGHTYKYYMENPAELELPSAHKPNMINGLQKNTGAQKDSLVIKPSNIRIWIHQRDLGRLQKVLWEGQGAKLRTEHSNNAKVKRFLEAIPYLMGAIKEIHSAAINNDLGLIQDRTSDPVPSVIMSSKDCNGLNAMHKAAGLGHKEIVQYIIERYPKAVTAIDLEGRTPLHYAAILKDGDELYNMLINAGAEESILDNRQKTAAYYKTRPNEIDTKLLQVIPDAPRTASNVFPASWDWNLLAEDNSTAKSTKKSDSMFGTTPVEEKKITEILAIDQTPDEPECELVSKLEPEVELIPEQEPEPETETEPEEKEETEPEEPDPDPEPKVEETIFNEVEESNEPEFEAQSEPDPELDESDQLEGPEKLEPEEIDPEILILEENEDSSPRKPNESEEPSDTPESQKIGVIEGVVNGEDEVETFNNDENNEDENENGNDIEVSEMVESGNMEQLAALVLSGEGDRLIGLQSHNPEIQSFLENVSTYMSKINRVHMAARDGSLRDLQAALDRRKFAIAKDHISPNGASPLHVATVFGSTSIVRYLAGRFPETLQVQDDNGRTPLHYAATVNDNGHYYNLLLHLGANANTEDKFGHMADYYKTNNEEFSHRQLLQDFGAKEDLNEETLTDKVPNDTVSARRDLDDVDMLAVLERCFRLLQGRRDSNATTTSASSQTSLNTNAVTILGKYLKRPVFDSIKTRLTRLDHNFYDVIWPSVKKLPQNLNLKIAMDADIPYGVIAPDYYSYAVFHEFFEPFLKEIHCLSANYELTSHPIPTYVPDPDDNNLDQIDIDFDLDTHAKWILSGHLESCRNLNNFELPKSLTVTQLERVERKLTTALMKPQIAKILLPDATEDQVEAFGFGTYYTMNEILEDPSEIRVTLAAAGLLIPLWNIGESDRLHGKHWPYGRGVFVSLQGDVAAWINVLDHLRIVTSTPSEKPGNIGHIYSKTCKILNELESQQTFQRDERLGFLSSRPTCVGNTLQFSLNIKFPYLIKEPGNLKHLCTVRGLSYHVTHHSSDIVRISNQQCLSITEIQTFEDFATAVTNILQLEKDLAMHNSLHIAQMFVYMFRRKKSNFASN